VKVEVCCETADEEEIREAESFRRFLEQQKSKIQAAATADNDHDDDDDVTT